MELYLQDFLEIGVKSTAMQIEKAMINDFSRVQAHN